MSPTIRNKYKYFHATFDVKPGNVKLNLSNNFRLGTGSTHIRLELNFVAAILNF